MPEIETETIEQRIKGLNAEIFLDKKFLALLRKEVPDIKFEHLCLFTIDPSSKDDEIKVKDHFTIGYSRRKDEKENITSFGALTPDGCAKLLKAIKAFLE